VQPADIGRLVTPGDPRVSPDGRRVAVVVTRVDLEADRYRSAVWLVAADGSSPARPLTAGEDSDANPAWSPDGTRLAFTRSAAGRHRLLVMPVGEPGEPVVLAERAEPLGGLAWSPDGSTLAFASREPRPAAEPITVRPAGDGPETAETVSKPPRRIDRLLPKLDGEGWIVDRPRAVFVVGTDTPAPPRLLVAHRYDVGAPAWSPDGRTLAVSTVRDVPDADLTMVEALHLVDVDGERAGGLRPVTGELTTSLSHPSFSPDGTRIAVLAGETAVVPSFGRVAVVPTAGGDPTVLTAGLDRQASPMPGLRAPLWRGDGELVFAIEEHGTQPLYRVPTDGSAAPEPVVEGTRAVVGYDAAAGTLALISTSPTERPELSVVRDGVETRLTAFSAAFHRDVPPDAPEHLRVASSGGGEIDAWVLRPRAAAGERVPVLLSVHGGPMTQYPTAWFDEFALWSGAGYAVVWCNPHGSTGDTEAFLQAIRPSESPEAPGTGWGGVDADDVLAALDAALAHDPLLDPEHVGVLGGSYGGFMTSWLVSHSDRFAAACSERAANNLLSLEWGGSDAAGYFRFEFGGLTHLDRPDLYTRLSPVTYAADIHTPMLLLHAEDDLRCPPEQADQLYLALRLLGREVEYWRFPDEGHELSRGGSPRHRVQRAQIILDFFARHLGGAPSAVG
jgi:dipeptidyl aminopeptidase/acylaminoacyl peptidase